MNPKTLTRACFAAYARMLLGLAIMLVTAAEWLDRNRYPGAGAGSGSGAFTQLLSKPTNWLVASLERSSDSFTDRG